jgi:hypothetical protein
MDLDPALDSSFYNTRPPNQKGPMPLLRFFTEPAEVPADPREPGLCWHHQPGIPR